MAQGKPFDEIAHAAFHSAEESLLDEARDSAAPLAALLAQIKIE